MCPIEQHMCATVRAVQPSMDSTARTHRAAGPEDTTQELISDELRRARRAKGWSQSQLGEAIGASRYTIIRLEAGKQDLTAEVAQQIELALEIEGLASLVTKREQLADSGGHQFDRDIVVRRLLRTPRLQRVRFVLADNLDVHAMVAGNPAVDDAWVQVFVPTAARERALFNGQPIYGHIEEQIKILSELADQWRDRVRGSLVVYESPDVLGPAILARSPAAIECAYWPVMPSESVVDGRKLHALSSVDPEVITKVEDHFEAVEATASRIWRNEALAIVDPDPRPKGEDRPTIFSRFQTIGEQRDQSENEAVTVALVLIHTRCPRRGLGIKRRILVYSRSDDPDRWSIPGYVVEEVDVRRARRTADGLDFVDLPRSSQESLAATLEHADYLAGGDGGGIPIDVFKEAASRGLFRDFGIEVAIERLEHVVLPPDLQHVSKDFGDGAEVRLVPRLFTLDLPDVAGTSATHELTKIKRRGAVDEWGYEDLAERDDLNDFLTEAKEDDFIVDLCRRLGVALR
jgi:transcriptional regulator with XRE-family HTH domain